MTDKTRRDFLFLATGVASAVGIGAVAWPFIDQLRPDEATLATASIEVDISGIEEGMSVTVKWRGQPVVIRNRTKKEIEEAAAVDISQLKDQDAGNPNLEGSHAATDIARSAGEGRENWLIMINKPVFSGGGFVHAMALSMTQQVVSEVVQQTEILIFRHINSCLIHFYRLDNLDDYALIIYAEKCAWALV